MSIRDDGPMARVPNVDSEQSIGSAAASSTIRTRYLRVRDEASDAREAFVRNIFGDVESFPYSDEGTFALSRANKDYDILIVDAADPSRMARYLRVNRALLRNVAKFAIMQESSPSRRVRMLAAGCDDVFDGLRMSQEEARMRVAAVMQRYHTRWAIWNEDQRVAEDMAQFAAPNALTPRELALLVALAPQQGKPMSVRQLCRMVAPPDPVQFGRALKFSISRLRSKLYPQWRIEAVPGRGYALLRLDSVNSENGVAGEAGPRQQTRMRLHWRDLQAPACDQSASLGSANANVSY